MISLLDLPVELRVNIFERVIYAERDPPPEYSTDAANDRAMMSDNENMRGRFFGDRIYCEVDKKLYHSTASKIQAVCHQFREEVKMFMKSNLVVYKLDLAIVQGRMLWPTWTSIPMHRSTVDIVEVKIRAIGPGVLCLFHLRGDSEIEDFGVLDSSESEDTESDDGGGEDDIGRGEVERHHWYWWFYSMLEQFFMIGIIPRSVEDTESKVTPDRKQLMAMRTLDVDFTESVMDLSDQLEELVSNEVWHAAMMHNRTITNCKHCDKLCHSWTSIQSDNSVLMSLSVQLIGECVTLLRPDRLRLTWERCCTGAWKQFDFDFTAICYTKWLYVIG